MNLNFRLKSTAFALAFILVAGFSACKKDSPTPGPVDPTQSTRSALTRDSLFLYAKQVYLWNDALPTYDVFNPQQYTSGETDLDNYNQELFAITRYGVDPKTNKPYEYRPSNIDIPKYSNIQDVNDKNPVAVIRKRGDVNTEGNGYDLGIYSFGAYGPSNSSYQLFIKAVSPGSPAAKAGLTRGTEITTINDTELGADFNGQVDLINSVTNNSLNSVKLSGIKKDGSKFTVNLNKASYKSSPVYKDTVLTVNGKKIGYLAYARFSELTNGDSDNPTDANLDPVFSRFAAQNVTDLIVDLRYNGGGFVNSAEYLVNLIAPSSASGTMYSEVYNSLMQAGNATILANQPLTDGNGKIRYGSNNKMLTYADVSYATKDNISVFSKKGNLTGVKNVVFLVSGGTASASELTINCLKPVVNVKLIGMTTYGKPVGFFPVTLENRYDVYFSMFETKNSKGEGSYYAGFTPDIIDTDSEDSPIFDDATHDFGDMAESYTNSAVNLLAYGSSSSRKATMSIDSGTGHVVRKKVLGSSNKIDKPDHFVGMIETRHAIK